MTDDYAKGREAGIAWALRQLADTSRTRREIFDGMAAALHRDRAERAEAAAANRQSGRTRPRRSGLTRWLRTQWRRLRGHEEER